MNIIERRNKNILFFSNSLNSFEINDKTKRIIKELSKNKSENKILQDNEVTKGEILEINNLITEQNSIELPVEDRKEGHSNYLKRLSINISNSCNMKCKYCYAQFGYYGSEKSLMNIDIIKETLDNFYSSFDEIAIIQVFGGEPFLHYEGFKYICEYIESKYEKGEIKYKTLITTVTNGTVLSAKIIELIKKHNIIITISLDGPKEIHDCNRSFLNDTGTFERIIKNIKKLKVETGQPQQIEATYNQEHVKHNISIIKLIEYIKTQFEDVSIHIAPVSGNKNECFTLENRDSFVDSVDDIFNYNKKKKNKANYLILDSMLQLFQNPEKKTNFCDAGISLFSVSYTGYVYPCYMFIDEPGFALCNVQDSNFSRSFLLNKAKKYQEHNRQEGKSSCKSCPIVNVCDGCLGMNYFNTGHIYTPVTEDCSMKRKMVKSIIFNINEYA
ncbi:radical SAM/SPASM domain-containing protein [Vagococcus hydrophili]|uniref:Radical SAM protein n=1 Tax=Vagococcus hydrophili TaxID=2714947 RepID=A0A6G8AUJ3_9ENTE|nr:radical SAM protein [Vagococcus hydrophili]QIL48738.1 radical SAM protein [Vagococcus hydrophili]